MNIALKSFIQIFYLNFLVILYIFHNAAIHTDGNPILWYVWTHRNSIGDLGTKRVRRTVIFLDSSLNIGQKKVIVYTLSNLYVKHLCSEYASVQDKAVHGGEPGGLCDGQPRDGSRAVLYAVQEPVGALQVQAETI